MSRALQERVAFAETGDGVRLALTEVAARFEDRAPSEAFLLIHGFAQNRHAFQRGAIPELLVDRGARVFLGELRGHGRSAHPGVPPTWTLETHLEHDLPALLATVRRETGADRVHLAGHSMGGILGYALLAKPERAGLASLITFASPVVLGADRWLLRLASLASVPLVRALRPAHVPMDRFLRLVAPLLTDPGARGGVLWFQQLSRLVNPHSGDPALLRAILEGADRESPAVFAALAAMAVTGRTTIAGIDLARAIRDAPLPIAAVFGARDLFTSRAGLACLEEPGARGPRLVLEVPDALHVDLIAGRHAARLTERLWDFVVRA